MYRSKQFRLREEAEVLEDLSMASRRFGHRVEKLFVADGDALVMPLERWEPILVAARKAFPRPELVNMNETPVVENYCPAAEASRRETGLAMEA